MTLYRWQASITDEAGNVMPGATVTVRNEVSGLLPTLYVDNAGATPLANPFTADANGAAEFYVAAGFYEITATLGLLIAEAQDANIGAMNASVHNPRGIEADAYLASSQTFDPTGTGLSSTDAQTALAEAAALIADREVLGRYSAIRDITGTTDTLVLADRGKLIRSTNASATTITIPPQASVAWLDRTRIDFMWYGAGQPTFAPGAGVTIRSEDSKLKIAKRYGAASLIRLASNEWVLVGNLAT